MSTPFVALIAFYTFAAAGGALLLVKIRRHNFALAADSSTGDATNLNKLITVWNMCLGGIFPVGYVALRSNDATYAEMLGMFAFPIPVLRFLFSLGLFWAVGPLGFWKQPGALGRALRNQCLSLGSMLGVCIAVANGTHGKTVLVPGFIAALSLGISIAQRRWGKRATKDFAIDETSPLRDETDRILEGFGVHGKPLMVRPFVVEGRELTHAEEMGQINQWANNMDPEKPWIPRLMLDRLEAGEATASLANVLSRKRAWRPAAARRDRVARVAGRIAVYSRHAIVFVGAPLLVLAAATSSIGFALSGLAVLFSACVILVAARLVQQRLHHRSPRKRAMEALTAWISAEPSANRTATDFLMAEVMIHKLWTPAVSPESLLNTLMQQPTIKGLMEEAHLNPEVALAEIRERLNARARE